MQELLKNAALDYGGAAIAMASNTDSNSTRFDMSGFESILFFTTITDCADTGVATLTIETNTADSDTGMTASAATDTATSAADDDLNGNYLAAELVKPLQRYCQGVRTTATANVAFGEIYAIRLKSRKAPRSASSTAAGTPSTTVDS